jgi:hypothetical protein
MSGGGYVGASLPPGPFRTWSLDPMPILPPDLDPLFSERSLTTLLRGQIARMKLAIDELGDDVFLQNSLDDLIETIMDIGRLQPLVLHKDSGISHPPIQIDNLVPASPPPLLDFATR